MADIRPRLVLAAKVRRCEGYDCNGLIFPGELYVRHAAYPGQYGQKGWWTSIECYPCAIRKGRKVS